MRRYLYHLINGVRSGIPLCCVAHWLAGITGLNNYDPNYMDASYVRCHTCATTRRVVELKNNGCIMRWLISWKFHKEWT
jgi:hypothetical protein